MDLGRFTIRCPSCLAEGKARLEMLNRRVRCKHCEHTFRAIPIESAEPDGSDESSEPAIIPIGREAPGASPHHAPRSEKPPRDSLRLRVEALEREVRAIRRSLAAEARRQPEPGPGPDLAPEAADLRGQLDRAMEAARAAEGRQVAQQVADAERIEALRREVAALRERAGDPEAPAAEPFRPWP